MGLSIDSLGSYLFKYIDMKTRHKIALVAFTILVVGIVMYITLPFPKFEQIDVRDYTIPDDKKSTFRFRLYAYNHYTYVHKGMSFSEIPCYSNDGSKHILDIKFNWDNSISISEKDHKTILHIDSIHFERTLLYGLEHDSDKEYFFENISFIDTQQMCDSMPSSIVLYRQKRDLCNGPRRYGFELFINNQNLTTGNENVFNY